MPGLFDQRCSVTVTDFLCVASSAEGQDRPLRLRSHLSPGGFLVVLGSQDVFKQHKQKAMGFPQSAKTQIKAAH